MSYTTNLSQKQIEALTEILASTELPRTATKPKAIERLRRYAIEREIATVDLLGASYDDAAAFIRHRLANPPKAKPVRAKVKAASARTGTVRSAEPVAELVITAEDKRRARTVERSWWRIEKAGVVADVRWDRATRVFICAIEAGTRKVAAEARSYGASISAAVRSFNGAVA